LEISEDKEESGKSRIIAISLHKKMSKKDTGLFTLFWNDILGQLNKTSETLQNPRLDVNTAASALVSLKEFVSMKRDSFAEYEIKLAALDVCDEYEIETQRKRKINVRLAPLDCVQAPEVELTPSHKFLTQSFLPVIDQFESSLQTRLEAYKLVDTRFGFLNKLDKLNHEEIISAADNLVKIYDNDLDEQFGNELIQFKTFYREFPKDEKNEFISEERWMYYILLEKKVSDCFPNIEVTLRMYLSLMITNSSGERSFSKLKLIKNRLRTSMLDDRLNNLALMSIESDILRKLEYEDIIKDFTTIKDRRKQIRH
jgi:hAT family C-terminal dimerisation region